MGCWQHPGGSFIRALQPVHVSPGAVRAMGSFLERNSPPLRPLASFDTSQFARTSVHSVVLSVGSSSSGSACRIRTRGGGRSAEARVSRTRGAARSTCAPGRGGGRGFPGSCGGEARMRDVTWLRNDAHWLGEDEASYAWPWCLPKAIGRAGQPCCLPRQWEAGRRKPQRRNS